MLLKTLYLIRHGATEGGDIKRYKGSIDVPLSEEGMRQMEEVGKALRSMIEDSEFKNQNMTCYTSPLSRALKSAEIICEALGLRPLVLNELRERDFGLWEGMTFLEIKEKYPVEFENWANNPLKYKPPYGESTIEVRDRVMKVLDEVLFNVQSSRFDVSDSPYLQPNIIIVAHGGVNRIILTELLGMSLENIFRIEQDYGAVNIIELWKPYQGGSKDSVIPVVKLMNGRFYEIPA